MMYRTELVEGITVENVTEKINAKIEEMEKESYRLVTMSFGGTERAVLVFKKRVKGSLLLTYILDLFECQWENEQLHIVFFSRRLI